MKVTTTFKSGAIAMLSKAQAMAMAQTAQQMLNEIRNDAVIPFDTGNTQNESTYVDDSQATRGVVSIVTDNPYARRLYFHPEYHFKTLKNANARGEWWEEFIKGDKKNRPRELFKALYKRNAGGLVK